MSSFLEDMRSPEDIELFFSKPDLLSAMRDRGLPVNGTRAHLAHVLWSSWVQSGWMNFVTSSRRPNLRSIRRSRSYSGSVPKTHRKERKRNLNSSSFPIKSACIFMLLLVMFIFYIGITLKHFPFSSESDYNTIFKVFFSFNGFSTEKFPRNLIPNLKASFIAFQRVANESPATFWAVLGLISIISQIFSPISLLFMPSHSFLMLLSGALFASTNFFHSLLPAVLVHMSSTVAVYAFYKFLVREIVFYFKPGMQKKFRRISWDLLGINHNLASPLMAESNLSRRKSFFSEQQQQQQHHIDQEKQEHHISHGLPNSYPSNTPNTYSHQIPVEPIINVKNRPMTPTTGVEDCHYGSISTDVPSTDTMYQSLTSRKGDEEEFEDEDLKITSKCESSHQQQVASSSTVSVISIDNTSNNNNIRLTHKFNENEYEPYAYSPLANEISTALSKAVSECGMALCGKCDFPSHLLDPRLNKTFPPFEEKYNINNNNNNNNNNDGKDDDDDAIQATWSAVTATGHDEAEDDNEDDDIDLGDFRNDNQESHFLLQYQGTFPTKNTNDKKSFLPHFKITKPDLLFRNPTIAKKRTFIETKSVSSSPVANKIIFSNIRSSNIANPSLTSPKDADALKNISASSPSIKKRLTHLKGGHSGITSKRPSSISTPSSQLICTCNQKKENTLQHNRLLTSHSMLTTTTNSTLEDFVSTDLSMSRILDSLDPIAYIPQSQQTFVSRATFVIVMRLSPLLPSWLFNAIGGLLALPLQPFIFGSLVGSIINSVLFLNAGAGLSYLMNIPSSLESIDNDGQSNLQTQFFFTSSISQETNLLHTNFQEPTVFSIFFSLFGTQFLIGFGAALISSLSSWMMGCLRRRKIRQTQQQEKLQQKLQENALLNNQDIRCVGLDDENGDNEIKNHAK